MKFFHHPEEIRCVAVRAAILLLFFLLSLCLASPVLGARVTLEWDPPSDTANVEGYRIHSGIESGNYTQKLEVPGAGSSNATVDGLELGTTYYFAATSYNATQESAYTQEVEHTPKDSDGDGLSDYDESHFYSTDPDVADTDGDGIEDKTERDYWNDLDGHSWDGDIDGDGRVNLLDPDSDGDGFDDGVERQESTDPGDDTSTPNDPPVAESGSYDSYTEGDTVVLDGSNSHDPNDNIASYSWEKTEGPSIDLQNSTSVKAEFTAPEVGSDGDSLTFTLTVTDAEGATDTDNCTINVTNEVSTNTAPTAVADAEPQEASAGDIVSLEGYASDDPEGDALSYTWTQISGEPQVTINSATSDTATFEAPSLSSDTALKFQLQVSDGSLTDTDTCTVNVSGTNTAPTAQTGEDRTVEESTTVYLNAFSSSDDESGIVSYHWTQTEGKTVTLSDPKAVNPSFVAPVTPAEGASLQFELTVEDESGLTGTDTVSFTVEDNGNSMDQDLPDEAHVLYDSKSGKHAAIQQTGNASLIALDLRDPDTISAEIDRPETMDYKLFSFELKTSEPGETAQVKFHFEDPLPEGHVWHKYDDQHGWHKYEDNAQISSDNKVVTLTLTDGGRGDQDGQENMRIVDPSGPGSATTVSSDDSSSPSVGGCVFNPNAGFGWGWLLLLMPIALLRVLGRRLGHDGSR
ncbi:MAG: choice-of-anchor U domain-containing protein [Desulfohalobiaceae bacterium]